MNAWDFDRIIAHLLYIRQPIRSFNESKVHTRRIHLLWHLVHIGRNYYPDAALDEAAG
jgi:hypothetical protein